MDSLPKLKTNGTPSKIDCLMKLHFSDSLAAEQFRKSRALAIRIGLTTEPKPTPFEVRCDQLRAIRVREHRAYWADHPRRKPAKFPRFPWSDHPSSIGVSPITETPIEGGRYPPRKLNMTSSTTTQMGNPGLNYENRLPESPVFRMRI